MTLAQVGVERAERFVEKQDVGLDHQRAGQRDALPLAAGQALGPLVGHVHQIELVEHTVDLAVAFGGCHVLDVKAEIRHCRARSCAGTARSSGRSSMSAAAPAADR